MVYSDDTMVNNWPQMFKRPDRAGSSKQHQVTEIEQNYCELQANSLDWERFENAVPVTQQIHKTVNTTRCYAAISHTTPSRYDKVIDQNTIEQITSPVAPYSGESVPKTKSTTQFSDYPICTFADECEAMTIPDDQITMKNDSGIMLDTGVDFIPNKPFDILPYMDVFDDDSLPKPVFEEQELAFEDPTFTDLTVFLAVAEPQKSCVVDDSHYQYCPNGVVWNGLKYESQPQNPSNAEVLNLQPDYCGAVPVEALIPSTVVKNVESEQVSSMPSVSGQRRCKMAAIHKNAEYALYESETDQFFQVTSRKRSHSTSSTSTSSSSASSSSSMDENGNEKKRKNNEASKRSRDKKKLMEEEKKRELEQLEKDNKKLWEKRAKIDLAIEEIKMFNSQQELLRVQSKQPS